MSDFDVNRYFQQAAGNIEASANDPSPWDGVVQQDQPKQTAVAEAAQRKVQALREQEARRKKTWAGQLGLEADSLAGGAVNLGASAVAATTEAAGDLAALPFGVNAMMGERDIPDEIHNAYARYKKGTATEQDMALLNQRNANDLALRERDGYTPKADAEPAKSTFLEALELADRNRDTARDIDTATDTGSIVDRTAQQGLSDELRAEGADGIAMLDEAAKAYENGDTFAAAKQAALGLADLVAVGGSALANNKQAVLEYAAEIVPDLVIGAVSSPALVARNVGYGLDAYNQGLENYAADNDGAAPSEAERRWMAANAFGMALMDTVGETSLLKAMKKSPVKGKLGSAGRTVKAGAGGTAVEGGTEGIQTAMEGEATARPASGLDVFEGVVTGAGAGGTVATGGRAAAEAAGATEEQQQIRDEEDAAERSVDQTIATKITEGDFDSLTNPDNAESYPLDRVAVALQKAATSENATPEQKQASEAALKKMANRLDEAVTAATEDARGIDKQSREDLKNKIRQIDALKAQKQATGDLEGAKQFDTLRKESVEQLKAVEALPKADRDARVQKLNALREAQALATKNRVDVARTRNPGELVSKARDTKASPEDRRTAAKEAVTYLMADSQAMSPEQIQSLVDDANTILSDSERNYLRTLSDAAVARNAAATLETTSRDVFSAKARDGFKSLPEYQNAFANAIQADNTASAQQQLDGLRNWSRSHQTKARLARQAMEQAGPGRQMAIWADPTAEGGWRLEPYAGKKLDAQLRKNGGLSFNAGSRELVEAIETEAAAIAATEQELTAALSVINGGMPEPDTETTPETAEQDAQADRAADEQADLEQETVDAEESTDTSDEQPATPDAEETAGDVQEAPTPTDGEPESGEDGTDRPDAERAADEGTTDGEDADSGVVTDAYGLTFSPVKGQLSLEQFKTTNLVEAYFTPRRTTDDGRSRHPLTAQEDFLSTVWIPAVKNNGLGLDPFVPELDTSEGSKQLVHLHQMTRFVHRMNKRVAQGFKPRTEASRRFDFLQYLADAQGNLPENVHTAISVAAADLVKDLTGAGQYNDASQIAKMLGKSSSDEVTSDEKQLLFDKGDYEFLLAGNAGQKALQALGLKASKDAPVNHVAQLELSLGHAVLEALYADGVLERVGVRDALLKDQPAIESTREGSEPIHWFARLVRDEAGDPVERVAALYETSKGSESISNKLFAVEDRMTGPVFEAPKLTQTTTKNRDEKIPSEQRAIIENEMATKAWTLRQDMKGLVEQLETVLPGQSQALLARMAGAVDTDTYVVQASNEGSIKGKNDALAREIQHILDFYQREEFAEDPDKPFYFPLSVWVNQRVGMASNTVNPLASKVHRFMIQMPEWAHSVPVKGAGKGIDKKAQHRHRQFKLAVLEGLGKPVDKQSNATSLKGFDAAVKAVQPHIDTLTKLTTGQAVEPQAVTALAEYVAKEEKFHTLDTLVHLSRWQLAKKTGDTEFTSTLIREGDGITNGPALATILSGAWGSVEQGLDLVAKMGFFGKNSKHQSAGAWQEDAANNDLYQSLAAQVSETVRQEYRNLPPAQKAVVKGITDLMGPLTAPPKQDQDVDGARPVTSSGRKRVKTPLTAMAFGSGVDKAIASMGDEVVDLFFERVEGVLNNGQSTTDQEAEIKTLVASLNAMLPTHHQITGKVTVARAKNLTLSPTARKAAVGQFQATVGKHVEKALKDQFGQFIEFRNQMNTVAKRSYQMFQLARDYEERQFLKELADTGELPVDGQGFPLQALTRRQQEELDARVRAISPVMHTAMSKASSELSAGLHMASIKSKVQYGDPAYEVNSRFGKFFPVQGDHVVRWVDNKGNERVNDSGKRNALQGYGKAMSYGDPGVRPFIMSVHALDSAIASRTYKDFPALNVHDAEIIGAHMMQEVAGQMNQETFKALVNYSLPEAFMQTGYRVLRQFEQRLDTMQADPEFVTAYNETIQGGTQRIHKDLRKALVAADRAEANKLALLSEIQTVNQYGVEGGEYTLDADDYARVAERAKTRVSQRVLTDQKLREDVLSVESEEAPEESQAAETGWGTLGRPVAPSDPTLVKALEADPEMPVRELLRGLPKTALTEALARLVDPDLRVKYITKDTPEDVLPETDVSRARGFWTLDNGREFLGIKSPDFVDSGVTAEMVTHEALHAVLYQTIEDDKADKSARGRRFVKEIEQLRGKAIQHLEANGLMEQHGNAVQNTHEFVAWGMTNAAFQQELAKIATDTKNRENVLTRFFAAIKRAVFGGRVPDNSGLESLVLNVTGLMETADQRRKSEASVTLKQEFGPTPETLRGWTTAQVYNGLANGELDDATDQRLKDVLGTVVEKVHGPFGAWVNPEGLETAQDVFIEAQATGKLPFASVARTAFPLSDQQSYVLEQVEASLREALASDTLAYKDLARMFQQAKGRIHRADLDTDPDAADAKYRMLFDLKQVPGSSRTDHLSRFAALVLVEPTVYNLLDAPAEGKARREPGLGNQVKHWFDRTTQELSDHLNKTHTTQPMNQRVQTLGERLADIEAKHRADLARTSLDTVDKIEAAGKKLGDAARQKLSDVARSDAIANSNSGYVQALGNLTSDIAEDRVQELLDALEEYRAWQFKKRQGVLASLITELRGSTESTQIFHRLLRMAGQNERERKHINENVKNDVRDRFVSFTKEESDAFTRTVLRTDVAGLMPHYDPETLTELMNSPQRLAAETRRWEQEVQKLGHHQKHYMTYARLLGYFMATGKARGPHMSLNAYNIARLAGTTDSVTDQQVADAEAVLDPLITLYALQYTSLSARKTTAMVMRREAPRGKASGVLYALKLHEKLKNQALDELFDGDKALFMKGYTREIYNPHRELKVAGAVEGAQLEKQGWIQMPKHLVQDKTDPDQSEKFIYMLPHGGLQSQVTGSVSYTGMRRKGTAIHGGEWLITEQDIHRQNQRTNAELARSNYFRVKQTARQGRDIRPELVDENFLVPVYNQHGDIVNYRYMMSEQNKDELLERNNRTEDVLASMASHMFDKTSSQTQNRQVVESLKAQHDLEYQRRPEAFIKVGPDSDDKQARETYHLLPPATKQAIRDVWGGNDMWVRADVIDMVFGYRKFSVSNLFDKPEMESRIVQAIRDSLVDIIASRYFLGDKAKLRIRQAEDMWQELVKEVKDAWVIKNLTTLLGNIASNVSILVWNGMSPKKIVETHKTATLGLLQYLDDHEELTSLKREQELELTADPQAAEQRILELQDAIDRNPVKGLIDEGMFQTILEDVDAESDDYSYKSRLSTKLAEATDGLPSAVKTGAKWAYMAHDTSLYKLLFKGTQMSDFVARYSLYQHLTTRKRDPLDHTTAIQRIADTFVNYDVPTHRLVQYLNDTGLIFFSKYYLRIQKVLMNLFQEKPARGLMMAVLENQMSSLPTVLDSGPRVANPLDAGALNYPGSLTEILPIKLGLSLF